MSLKDLDSPITFSALQRARLRSRQGYSSGLSTADWGSSMHLLKLHNATLPSLLPPTLVKLFRFVGQFTDLQLSSYASFPRILKHVSCDVCISVCKVMHSIP